MPTAPAPAVRSTSGVLKVLPLAHAQGCRGYLLFDPAKREAAALDLHLDQAAEVAQLLKDNELALRFVIDSHTHADHPSAAQKVATAFGATRVAHEKARHKGAGHHPKDGEVLPVGGGGLTVRHAPGHTPDHLVLETPGAVFSGDTLFIGSVARTDFLGGNAGELFDTLGRVFGPLPAETVLYPGHDYADRPNAPLDHVRRTNPMLQAPDYQSFLQIRGG